MIFFDCETVGFHGMPVLIQWAENDGPIYLHDVWGNPIYQTLELIEKFCSDPDGVVGFNISFDWFHICKIYTTLSLYHDYDEHPEDIIDELAELEMQARDGNCCKPTNAFDIMLHARKGPYQSTMDRGDVRIRRVPTALAWELASELEKRVPLSDILFARRKDKNAKKWVVYDVTDKDGDDEPNFKDVVLKFAPSSALKALAIDALKIPADELLRFADIELPDACYPEELGYAPFAKAIGSKADWKGAWPEKIRMHISHWRYNDRARYYAKKDVEYTRDLYKFFGSPACGDDDSVLACMVSAVRWKGYAIDVAGLKGLKQETLNAKFKMGPDGKLFEIPTSANAARKYISEKLSETEKAIIQGSTKKILLEEIAKYKQGCLHCSEVGCDKCQNGVIQHPAAVRASEVLAARQSNYEANLYDKLIVAGRFHASFKVIGALSTRMAGADDLNAQGIKREKRVRNKFQMAFPGFILCGGDFDGFEVTLAEACYNDPDLRADLLSGKKIHALFGVHVYPDMTYEQILATSGTDDDRYTRCKSAVFAMFYGGEGFTLKDRLGVDLETADKAYAAFCKRYKRVGFERARVFNMFCALKQVGGIGSRIEWHDACDYIESMFGFRRYFTLENSICKALYELANKPPKHWKDINIKVMRRDRTQSAMGASQSALYGAIFGQQANNMRAAANHVIQSSGAEVTKMVQRKIWDMQPAGMKPFRVIPANIHDEILVPCLPEYTAELKRVVDSAVESVRPKVPMIKMEWETGKTSWADK